MATENPQHRQTSIRGGAFGYNNPSDNHSIKSKQLKTPSASSMAEKRGHREPVDSDKVIDIVSCFGFKREYIRKALDVLQQKSGHYNAEDLLDIIYLIEDESERNIPEVKSNTGPLDQHYMNNKHILSHVKAEPRAYPLGQSVFEASSGACGSSYSSLPGPAQVFSNPTEVTKKQCHKQERGFDGVDSEMKSDGGSGEESSNQVQDHLIHIPNEETNPQEQQQPVAKATITSSSSEKSVNKEDSNGKTTSTEEEDVYRGGHRASKTKKKKKKKVSKNKQNDNITETRGNTGLASGSSQSTTSKTPDEHQVLVASQTESQTDTWVDVRPKQLASPPLSPGQVIKTRNSQTNEDVTKLVEQNRKLQSAKFCRICKVNQANLLLLTCRHLVCCESCGEESQNCPLCDKQVIATVKVYMA